MDYLFFGFGSRRLSKVGISLYRELEISKTATEPEINHSYRKLALKWHPDKNPGNQVASEKFKEINRAHKILTDVKKKEIYDEFGSFGLFLAEKYGENEVGFYSLLFNKWIQVFGVLTCCCFCCFCCFACCCNGCCGLCCKDEDGEEQQLIPNVEELQYSTSVEGVPVENPVIITQPQE